jgi:hypothetical protein
MEKEKGAFSYAGYSRFIQSEPPSMICLNALAMKRNIPGGMSGFKIRSRIKELTGAEDQGCT